MRVSSRTIIPGPSWALALGVLVAGLGGGCSDTPTAGTRAVESPEAQKNREESIKDAMRKGAYGPKYKEKSVPPR
jgi:hypothetical protein